MKHVKFIYDNNEIKEGIIEEDEHFAGGFKVIYENCILSIKIVTIIE
jgi:hypothetical protein